MAETIRSQIVKAFQDKVNALGVLTPSDLKDRTVWPAIGLLDQEDVVTKTEYGSNFLTMAVRVEMIDVYNSSSALSRYGSNDTIIIANEMIGKIIIAAIATDRTLNGLCETIRVNSSTPVYPEAGSNLIGAFVDFEIDFRFDVNDPYTDSFEL